MSDRAPPIEGTTTYKLDQVAKNIRIPRVDASVDLDVRNPVQDVGEELLSLLAIRPGLWRAEKSKQVSI